MNYSSVDLLLAYYMCKIDEIFSNSDYTNSDVCYMLSDLKNEISNVKASINYEYDLTDQFKY